MDARKYRTCGHGCVRRGSAPERTRLNAGATKTVFGAGISATPLFHRFIGRIVDPAKTPLPHRSPVAGPYLTRASISFQHLCSDTTFRDGGNIA